MTSNPYQKRLDALFADIERLAVNPMGEVDAVRHELELLRARVDALQAEIETGPISTAAAPNANNANSAIQDKARYIAPGLYEEDRVGYVFDKGTVRPLQGPENDAEKSASQAAVPLTVSGQVIGKMEAVTSPERTWSPEEISLLNSVAQQASLQIQNIRLLDATERARAEAESATRRFIHESWDSYLDGIRNSERIGYSYNQDSVRPVFEPPAENGMVQETVNVMDEQVGTLYLQPDPSHPLTDVDRAMVSAIAKQVAQQVENIRLLADASRARAEAEDATRRLTRESWEAYAAQKEYSNLGVVYDLNEVIPLGEAPLLQNLDFSRPLTVRGEVVGHLATSGGKEISQEEANLANAIAERVSVHLETIRLAEELQKRAAELQTVAKLSTTASTVLNPDELLQSVVDMTKERFGLYHAHIYLANDSWNTLLLAAGSGEVGQTLVAEQHAISIDAEKSIVARASREQKAIIVNDARTDPAFLPNPHLPDTRSEMAVPMIVGDKTLGVFDVQSQQANRFSEEDANIYTTLASQVGVALQNARLYAEQAATLAQLRELDRLKSSFLANMSHELRTPLNSILGFADVILEELDGPLTENMTNDLRLIQKNGTHLLHLINDVLDMAKIEAGRMNLNPEKFFLIELLEEVTSITSPLASERNLALFIDPQADLSVTIYADRTRIRQVMINLVNNAIKFTESGKISIHMERCEAGVLVRVKDTGIGIPPDKLEAVFQEFTQVDTSTTRKVGGTGLGLPISRRLIEMHGGRLWAESNGINGEGSVFLVELPLEAKNIEPEKVQK